MNKHTPGPWHYHKYYRDKAHKKAGLSDGFVIVTGGSHKATDVGKFHSTTNTKADARLIAAAPELLEACLAIFNRNTEDPEGYDKAFDLVRSAIAKAKGKE